MTARLMIGDVYDKLAEIPDNSVDLCMTSPPFLKQRDYLPANHPDKHKEITGHPPRASGRRPARPPPPDTLERKPDVKRSRIQQFDAAMADPVIRARLNQPTGVTLDDPAEIQRRLEELNAE